MTDQTGPIIFANPTAREQLTEHGHVATFRTSYRTTGETWWRESRTGEKKGDVTVSHVERLQPVDEKHLRMMLVPHADKSGFDSAAEWAEVIVEMHDGLPDEGHVYAAVQRRAHDDARRARSDGGTTGDGGHGHTAGCDCRGCVLTEAEANRARAERTRDLREQSPGGDGDA